MRNKIILWALVLSGLFAGRNAAAQEELRITINSGEADAPQAELDSDEVPQEPPAEEIILFEATPAASSGVRIDTGRKFHFDFGGEYRHENSALMVSGADGERVVGDTVLRGPELNMRGHFKTKSGAWNSLGIHGGLLFSDPEYTQEGVVSTRAGIDFAHTPNGSRMSHLVFLDWENRAHGYAAGKNVGWIKELADSYDLPEDLDSYDAHMFTLGYSPVVRFRDGLMTFDVAPKMGVGLLIADGQEQHAAVKINDFAFLGRIGAGARLGFNLGPVNLFAGVELGYTRPFTDVMRKYEVAAGGVVGGKTYDADEKFQENVRNFNNFAAQFMLGLRARF